MAKRNNGDDEMESIVEHLDRQDKTLQEILVVIRGSVALGVDGVLTSLKEMRETQTQIISDVAHLQRWKKMVQENKGKVTFTFMDGAKILFSLVGLAFFTGLAFLATDFFFTTTFFAMTFFVFS